MPETGEIERIHSSNPVDYPLRGRKPMGTTPWGRIVLDEGLPWLGNGEADVRWASPDADLILSLGCTACLCAPIRWAGRTLGVLSLNDIRDSYGKEVIGELSVIAGFLAVALVPGCDVPDF